MYGINYYTTYVNVQANTALKYSPPMTDAAKTWKVAVLVNLKTKRAQTVVSESPLTYACLWSIGKGETWCPKLIVAGFTPEKAVLFWKQLKDKTRANACMDECRRLYDKHHRAHGLGLWHTEEAATEKDMITWTTEGCPRGHLYIPLKG